MLRVKVPVVELSVLGFVPVVASTVGHRRGEVGHVGAGLDRRRLDFGVAGQVVGDAVERVGGVALPGVVGRRTGRGHVRPERPGPAVDRRVNVVRRNARRGRAAIGAGDRHGEDKAGLARGNALIVLVGGVVSISHDGRERVGAGVAIGVLDAGGVDGQRVVAVASPSGPRAR